MNRRQFLGACVAGVAAVPAAVAESQAQPVREYGSAVDVQATGVTLHINQPDPAFEECMVRLFEGQIEEMQRKGLLSNTL